LKIGIIGRESSHAKAFSDICKQNGIEPVVDDHLEVSGDLNGVMIVTRNGNTHKDIALPFIDAGIPVWIDKPFAVRMEDAQAMIDLARRKNCPVTGGSTCKFAPDVIRMGKEIREGAYGGIRSGMINYPIMLDSPYNGIHFYAHHLVEMVLSVFGYDIRWVRASQKNGGLITIAGYDDYDVVMNFQPDIWDSYVTILGTEKQVVRQVNLSNIYEDGVAAFLQMITTGIMPVDYSRLVLPTVVVNGIERSYRESVEIYF
jgi:predicted dehydrogenase